MALFGCLLVSFTIFVSVAVADDNLFNSTTEIRKEVVRVGGEAADVATAPVSGQGIWGTLATAGAVGLTYLFDNDIRTRIQDEKSSSLDKAAKAGSIVGDPFLHLGIAAAVYTGGVLAGSAKHEEIGEMLGEAALLADASSLVLKEAIGRERPFAGGDKGSFRPFQFKGDFDSLPSMHTASSFAMASVLAETSESTLAKVFYYGAATFVGFSRLYQDKHWASDIILGAAVGELCGRVAISTHVNKGSALKIMPMVSENAVSLAMIGRW